MSEIRVKRDERFRQLERLLLSGGQWQLFRLFLHSGFTSGCAGTMTYHAMIDAILSVEYPQG